MAILSLSKGGGADRDPFDWAQDRRTDDRSTLLTVVCQTPLDC